MIDGSQQPQVTWRKSNHSGSGQECVEVARLLNPIPVRDVDHPDGPFPAR